MNRTQLYPLRFEPIFKSAIWGGHRLHPFLRMESPAEPIGEAWVLSDQGDNRSRIINGPFADLTIGDLMHSMGERILGQKPAAHGRFPLLLKFLDAVQPLSVQVHPNDTQAKVMVPPTDPHAGLGKTEAWVVLDHQPQSVLYAGLKKEVTPEKFHTALHNQTLPETLHTIQPHVGDCIFLRAGTVHAIGAGLMLFEVQQTSDITFRLYDWGRVDTKTGKPRQLHIEESLICTDFSRGPIEPVRPFDIPTDRNHKESLVSCEYFVLDRWTSLSPFEVGCVGSCRIVVCVAGEADLLHLQEPYSLKAGDVLLLPAEIGACTCIPKGSVTLLEITVPK